MFPVFCKQVLITFSWVIGSNHHDPWSPKVPANKHNSTIVPTIWHSAVAQRVLINTPVVFTENKKCNGDKSCANSDGWQQNSTQTSDRLSESVCSLLVNAAVCVQDRKGLMWRNCPNSSMSALSAGMRWHQWPNCHFSFCSGHNYNISLPGWCLLGVGAAVPGGECPQLPGRIVFGHLTSTWVMGALLQDGPCYGGFQTKTVFAQDRQRKHGEAECSALKNWSLLWVGGSPPCWPTTHSSCVASEHKTLDVFI